MKRHLFTFTNRAFFPTVNDGNDSFEWMNIPSHNVVEQPDHFKIVDDDGEDFAIIYKHAITSIVITNDND